MDQFLYKTIDIATAIDVKNRISTSLSSPINVKTGFNNVINYQIHDDDVNGSADAAAASSSSSSSTFVKGITSLTSSTAPTGHRKNAETTGRKFNRADAFNISNGDSLENSVILTGLKPLTEYTILVQAYNSMGAGPQSDQVNIRTLEEGEPSLFTT